MAGKLLVNKSERVCKSEEFRQDSKRMAIAGQEQRSTAETQERNRKGRNESGVSVEAVVELGPCGIGAAAWCRYRNHGNGRWTSFPPGGVHASSES